jgi:hypothetical protein
MRGVLLLLATLLAVPPAPKATGSVDLGRQLHLAISIDRERYLRHEPVNVRITLSNTGDRAVEIDAPRFGRGSLQLTLAAPGSRAPAREYVDFGNAETLLLAPGDKIVLEETVEIGRIGENTLTAEFRGVRGAVPEQAPLRGEIEQAAVTFQVDEPEDPAPLVEEKIRRVLRRAEAELASYGPDYPDAPRSLSDLRCIGPDAAERLIALVPDQADPRIRKGALSELALLRSPDAVACFREAVADEDEGVQGAAVRGLYLLYQGRPAARDEAFQALLDALMNGKPSTAESVADILKTQYDFRIQAAFEEVVRDDGSALSRTAARYLASFEGLNLADWLDWAAKEPTLARYVALRDIADDVVRDCGPLTMALPDASWEAIRRDDALMSRYQESVRALVVWVRRYPRYSYRYFAVDRREWPKPQ